MAMASASRHCTVYTWGTGTDGQLGHFPFEKRGITAAYEEVAPRKLEIPYKLKHIACGLNHTLAVTADGELVAWGNGLYGKLGNGSTDSLLQPTVIKNAPQRLKYVSCGDNHSAAIDEDGRLFTWGFGGSFWSGKGMLGHSEGKTVHTPTLVESMWEYGAHAAEVHCGEAHTLIVSTDGEALACGVGEYGRLGTGHTADALVPEPLDFFANMNIVTGAARHAHCVVLTDTGEAFGWGKNDMGQLGVTGSVSIDMFNMETLPRAIEALARTQIVKIATGFGHTAATSASGALYEWGLSNHLEPAQIKLPSSAKNRRVTAVACGHHYTAAITEDGALWTWGRPNYATGHGRRLLTTPKQVEALAGVEVSFVSTGSYHMAAFVHD